MKGILKAALIPLLALLIAASAPSAQQKYIDTYAATAVREMYRSGVPASITLAQGILESGSGQSRLATEGNNHFGIKCHDWKGKSMKVDDDKPNECFRVYDDAEASFRDHSDFLRYKDRYKSLFEYEVTDYKSWAYGLKKAGYATNPVYAESLIRIIEEYGLSQYDTMTPDDLVAAAEPEQQAQEQPKQEVKKEKRKKQKAAEEPVKAEIPESPLSIEEAKPVEAGASELFTFSLTRRMAAKNGVPFIYAVDGESFSSIAQANHLFVKELLAYNDLEAEQPLAPGTIVYLQPKKKQAPKGLDKYIVEQDGELLRDICQRFAVRKSSIEKINGFAAGHTLREGDTVLLRKER